MREAESHLERFLEPERAYEGWTTSLKQQDSRTWETFVCSGGIFRCKVCGARWEEERGIGDRGTTHIVLRRMPPTSPDDYLNADIIRDRAERLTEAQHATRYLAETSNRTKSLEDQDRWTQAAQALRTAEWALYSPDLDDIVERLRTGDAAAVEPAIVFLEADPWCFRSGYLKERLMRYLSRISLEEEAKSRLRRVVLGVVVRGRRRELPMTRRLARVVANEELVSSLQEQLRKPTAASADHAIRYVLDGIVS